MLTISRLFICVKVKSCIGLIFSLVLRDLVDLAYPIGNCVCLIPANSDKLYNILLALMVCHSSSMAWVDSEWPLSVFGIPVPCYWLMELLNCVPLMVHWNIHHFSQAYILKYATPGYDTLQLCVNYKYWLLVMRHSCFGAMCISL